jgi:ParB/RepB/Spo0J family partition protein
MNTLFEASPTSLRQVPLQQIRPDPEQPRKAFDPEALDELAASIRTVGILQPILVREAANGYHTILYGERRWRAAKLAGLHSMPCLVLLTRMEKLTRWVVQCSENAHHHDLSPLEYVDVISDMRAAGLSTTAMAEALGKRPDWVRGHELAATPAYRALFESGRLRSVDVLLHFRSLPEAARRELLDAGDLITSTRCARMREKYRDIEARKAGGRQPDLPMEHRGSSFVATPPALSNALATPAELPTTIDPQLSEGDHALRTPDTARIKSGDGKSAMGHAIVSLAVPTAWIKEVGSVDALRRIAMAVLTFSRNAGWKAA